MFFELMELASLDIVLLVVSQINMPKTTGEFGVRGSPVYDRFLPCLFRPPPRAYWVIDRRDVSTAPGTRPRNEFGDTNLHRFSRLALDAVISDDDGIRGSFMMKPYLLSMTPLPTTTAFGWRVAPQGLFE